MDFDITPQSIVKLRKSYGLSQQAFARLLGIGEATLNRYEKGAVPTKANANLLRAATIPEFMAVCLEREGGNLSPRQRESVEKVVYAELTFDDEGEVMDINEIYTLTLQQEVLNEKAADILADIIKGLLAAEAAGDEGLKMVYNDMLAHISLLKPTITSQASFNQPELMRLNGELDCMRDLIARSVKRAA